MDNNDNQFNNSENLTAGFDAQQPSKTSGDLKVDVHFDHSPKQENPFEGILSNTVFSEPRLTQSSAIFHLPLPIIHWPSAGRRSNGQQRHPLVDGAFRLR